MTHQPPAVAALRRAGLTPGELAALTRTGEVEIVAQLVGRRAFSDATLDALREFLSPHLAEEIAALAGSSRAAYLEEVQAGANVSPVTYASSR